MLKFSNTFFNNESTTITNLFTRSFPDKGNLNKEDKYSFIKLWGHSEFRRVNIQSREKNACAISFSCVHCLRFVLQAGSLGPRVVWIRSQWIWTHFRKLDQKCRYRWTILCTVSLIILGALVKKKNNFNWLYSEVTDE